MSTPNERLTMLHGHLRLKDLNELKPAFPILYTMNRDTFTSKKTEFNRSVQPRP